MNHLQNHIDNYLVHCQTQKRLDAKTLKAYRMTYANFPNNLDYRFFDQFLYPFIVNFHRKKLSVQCTGAFYMQASIYLCCLHQLQTESAS